MLKSYTIFCMMTNLKSHKNFFSPSRIFSRFSKPAETCFFFLSLFEFKISGVPLTLNCVTNASQVFLKKKKKMSLQTCCRRRRFCIFWNSKSFDFHGYRLFSLSAPLLPLGFSCSSRFFLIYFWMCEEVMWPWNFHLWRNWAAVWKAFFFLSFFLSFFFFLP